MWSPTLERERVLWKERGTDRDSDGQRRTETGRDRQRQTEKDSDRKNLNFSLLCFGKLTMSSWFNVLTEVQLGFASCGV